MEDNRYIAGVFTILVIPITSFHHIGDNRYYRDILESVTSLRFSRPYMQFLRKYESEGKLLDSIYLGHADRVLEYRDFLSRGESRYQHLPRGRSYACI